MAQSLKKYKHEHNALQAKVDLLRSVEEIEQKYNLEAIDMVKLFSELTNRAVQRIKAVTFEKRPR
jgi:hypothetical protein